MPNTPVTWLDQQTVNATTTGTQSDPDIVQLSNGNILVSWTTNDPGGLGAPDGTETFAQIFDPAGNKIGGEIRLNNASVDDDEQNFDLAALPGGGFIAVYHDLDNPDTGGGSNIRLEHYDANGVDVAGLDNIVVFDTLAGGAPNYRNPVVAVSSATSALIVYEELDAGGAPDVVGKFYNPATNTYGPQFDLITLSQAIAAEPDVAVLSNGDYAIAQTYRSGGNNAIAYKVINPAGGVISGSAFVTGTNVGTDSDFEPSVTGLAGGGFVIAWTEIDAADTDVQFRVFNNAGAQTFAGSVNNAGAADNNNEPKVVALADGTFVVIVDNDVANTGEAARFTAAGAPLGSFTFTGPVISPAGIGLADGRFAAAWRDAGDIHLEIMDTRDLASGPHYTPTPWSVGTAGADTLSNAAGDTGLAAGLGSDTANMGYGLGDDFLFDGTTPDNVSTIGASGFDQFHDFELFNFNGVVLTGADLFTARALTGTKQANILTGLGGNDVLLGKKGDDRLNGGSGDDLLDGGKGNDVLKGGSGNDQLIGGKGADVMEGGAGDDSLTGGKGADTMSGGDGNDQLTGGKGADTMSGGAGNDQLIGGKGADILNGGLGADSMTGGKGADTFVYSSILDSGPAAGARDLINLFEGNGKDRIDVSAIDAIAGGANDAFTFIGAAAFTAAGQIRATAAGDNVTIEFETTGDNVADMVIDLVLKKGAIDASDFVL